MATIDETRSLPGDWIEHGRLRIRTERELDELYVVALHGEFDIDGVEVLTAELLRIEATDARRVIIDLSGLHFIDSEGLGVLCSLHERLGQDANRRVFLRGTGSVGRVMELTELDSMFPTTG